MKNRRWRKAKLEVIGIEFNDQPFILNATPDLYELPMWLKRRERRHFTIQTRAMDAVLQRTYGVRIWTGAVLQVWVRDGNKLVVHAEEHFTW